MAFSRREKRIKIKKRVRKNIFGTPEKPRMTVFRSNNHIYVQLIDDINGKTIVSASSRNKSIAEKTDIKKIETAILVGKLIAEKAIKAGIETVVFDRNGYIYHGRVKALADVSRKEGLKI